MKQHLPKERDHKRSHLRQATKYLTPAQRWAMGAALVNEYRKLVAECANARTPGHTALTAGGLTRMMWVCKNSGKGWKRGEKVLYRNRYEHLSSLGAKFRVVRYPRRKCVKDALKRMARVISQVHHPVQYGFVPQRNCVQSAACHAYARTVFLLDIENAFDQVTAVEVAEILSKVFRINAREARLIADLCCHDRHLYQGNPMAPALFNIRAMWMVDRLNRLCRANGAVMTAYADDLTISHEYWQHFSRGFRKTVYRIVAECGLRVNPDKCKVRAVSPNKVGHYDITGLAVDFDPATGTPYVRPMHRRRTLKKAAYIAHLRAKGIDFSLELNKEGQLKELELVEKGLANWARQRGEPGKPQLALRNW